MDKIKKEKVEGKISQQNKSNEQDKNIDNKNVKSNNEFPYYVILNDAWGTASKQQVKIPVRRYIEGSNVFLYNEKTGFKEEMPEDTDEYKQYKLEDLAKKIISFEDKIKAKNSNDSIKDLQQDLRQLKSWKRSIELQGRGSYMNFDIEGKPYFEFDRRGMFKLPVFKNVDNSLKYVPDESKIKEASDLIIENNKANGQDDGGLKLLNIAILVILVLSVCFFGWLMYETNTLTGQLGNNLVLITDSMTDLGITLKENTNDIINITEQLNVTEDTGPVKDVPVNVINQ